MKPLRVPPSRSTVTLTKEPRSRSSKKGWFEKAVIDLPNGSRIPLSFWDPVGSHGSLQVLKNGEKSASRARSHHRSHWHSGEYGNRNTRTLLQTATSSGCCHWGATDVEILPFHQPAAAQRIMSPS